MPDTDCPGTLYILDNERIFNLKTLVPDLEINHGQGNVSFVQKNSTVIIAIKTGHVVELSKVYKEMGCTVSVKNGSQITS